MYPHLFLCFFLFLSLNLNAQNCASGEYDDCGTCKACPEGYFCPGDDTRTPCEPGYYSATPGAPSCTACEVGRFNNKYAATSCESCPAGTFQSLEAATACIACGLGFYAPDAESTECLQCLPGTFQDEFGSTSCTACAPGSYQPGTGQTGCVQCNAGTAQSESGQIACTDCPSGTYQAFIGKEKCDKCPAGTANPLTAQTAATACVDCPVGRFASETGSSICENCEAGTFNDETAATDCKLCPPGKFSANGEAEVCSDCPMGTYQNDYGQSECINCPSGAGNTTVGATCPDGDCMPPLSSSTTHLHGHTNGEQIDLEWQYVGSSALGLTGFYVERSPDGSRFETIGFVDYQSNFGASFKYAFSDKNVAVDTDYYYRLRLFSPQRLPTYSVIINLKLADASDLELFPNPTENQRVTLKGSLLENGGEVIITDATGKVLQRTEVVAGSKSVEFGLAPYSAGVYFVEWKGVREETQTLRLVRK
ncbi:MAG: T9SS type A sorting domain-containing protein [Saprospiraceae bacterium]